jgi:hypothetical protein
MMKKHLGMHNDRIILEMHLKVLRKRVKKTFETALLMAAIILLMSAGQALAVDGKVIPLTDALKKALAPLGEGVVGKPVPAPVIHDPAKMFAMRAGTFEYQFVEGDKYAGKTHNEVYSKLPAKNGNSLWSHNIGETLSEEIEIEPNGSMLTNTEIDTEYGYGCHFNPGLTVAQKVTPGDSWNVESTISIYHEKTPDKSAGQGTISATRTYVGAYEVTTPAGRFDACLLINDYEIKVGAVKVRDQRYSFFAPGVGKVAEVEGLRVSAILIIHIHHETAKVLVKYPKDVTPRP